MFALTENNRFYLCCDPTDLRKGFNTLIGCIVNYSKLNPTDGSVYIFINKARGALKLLHWERGGLVLLLEGYRKLQKLIHFHVYSKN